MSEFARLEIEIYEERNPAIADNQVAEATLALKGVTLRAQDRARDLRHAINRAEEELSRQVKRHREKRRGTAQGRNRDSSAPSTEPEGFGEGDGHSDVTRTSAGDASSAGSRTGVGDVPRPQLVAGGSCIVFARVGAHVRVAVGPRLLLCDRSSCAEMVR